MKLIDEQVNNNNSFQKDVNDMDIDEILCEKKRLEEELKITDSAITKANVELTARSYKRTKSRSHRRRKHRTSKETETEEQLRDDISSVRSSICDHLSTTSDESMTWTGRSSSWQLSLVERDGLREKVSKQRNKHIGRSKFGVLNQADSRTMASLLYSGVIGEAGFNTSTKDELTLQVLTSRESQLIAELRRPKGMFTDYLRASIQKNVNTKATGHC